MDKGLLKHINDETIAIIPARGGSKSVPQKNIREFMGHPLIAYSIAAAKLSKEISRVLVSTDSEEIANISQTYGAEVPFLRPSELARDNSPDLEFVQHVISWLYEHENAIPRYLVHLRPTTPIRDCMLIDDAVRITIQDVSATSLRSGHRCSSPPYKWFKQCEGEKYLTPLMPGMSIVKTNLMRQAFPTVFVPNGYVDVLKTDCIIATDSMHGERMIGYWTEEVPDIDTELDVKLLSCYDGLLSALYELQTYLSSI